MKLLKKGFIVQFIGVLTLVFGNFYTAGAAVADVVATDEIAVKNAKLIDDKRQLVTNAKVGDKANLAFDATVGSLSRSGKVAFDYDEDVLKIKKGKYKFKNDSTKVVVDIDGKDSTIEWRHAIDKTDLEVVLPVKFNRPVDRRELTVAVDEKEMKLPTLTVVSRDAKGARDNTSSKKVDGNLQDDNLVNKVLAEAEQDEAASDQVEAAKQAEEAQKQTAKEREDKKKETEAKESQAEKKEITSKDSAEQPVQAESKKNEINANSSQADEIEEPEQSDSDKAKEFVKEKREADQKAAEEKSRKAVENLKKAAEKDARNSQSTNQNNSGIQRSSGNNKESQTPGDSSLASVDVAKKALAGDDDDDDADGASGESLRSTLPVNGVFRDKNGSRNLGKLNYFFDTIQLTDDEGNKQFIDGTLNDSVSIPASFRNSKEITINWSWNTQSINELNKLNPVIQDGDYYTFQIKGFEYAYKNGNSDSTDIKTPNGKTIGKFTISKTGEDDIQEVKIDFTPGVDTGENRIEYGASAKTTLSQDAETFSFGEIASDEHKITVEKGKLDLKKAGKYKTDENEQGVQITDYSKLHWTANFETEDALDEVTLQDEFGAGYDFQGATYKFTITPNEGKTVTISSSDTDQTMYKKVVGNSQIAQRANFKFIASELLGESKKIKAIQVDVIADITDFVNYNEYVNKIQVSFWKNGNDTGNNGPWAQAKVSNDRRMLNKKAEIVKGGNVKYTVRFTVYDADDIKNLVMTDTLGSELFKYVNESFVLEPMENEASINDYVTFKFTNNDSSDTGKASFSAQFKEKIKENVAENNPITYELSYEVTPKDPSSIKDENYKDLTNTVTWKGTSKFESVEDPKFNVKTSSGANWTDFTTDWTFEVNKFDRNVKFPIVITEPAEGTTNDYLNFSEFHETIRENAKKEGFNIANYIQIYANNGAGYLKQEVTLEDVWDGPHQGVEYNWKDSDESAFIIQKIKDSNDFKLSIKSSPPKMSTKNFKIELKQVPINKEALATAKNTVWNIRNCADIEYGEKEIDKVCASVALPKLVRENISKVGTLSEDFSNSKSNRQIHWTSSFNFKDYLDAAGKFTVTDNFGEGDSIISYKNDKPETERKQLQSIDYDQNDPAKNIKVSFGKLNEKGDQVEKYAENTDDFYTLSFKNLTQTSFELQIELTDKGKQFIKDEGYNVITLDYSTNVESLSLDSKENYEHLKEWLFNNNVSASGITSKELKASAQTYYIDAGYLLDKSGQKEIINDNGRDITAIKWNVLINGEEKEFTGPIQLVDQITGGKHNHLRAQQDDYHVKIYEAKRVKAQDKEKHKVEYEPGTPISSNNYTLEYSPELDKLTIQFKEGYQLNGPLIVQYYTEIQDTTGADFENKVTLSLGTKEFTQGTVLESGISAWGNIKHFSVNVIKRDDITSDPLEGVEFKLQKMGTEGKWQDVMTPADQGEGSPEVYKLKTGKDGTATFMDLTAKGTYRIVETEGLSGRFTQYESGSFTMADVEKDKTVYVLEVANPYDGDLIIKKEVNSHGLDTSNDEFTFDVKATNGLSAVNEDFNGDFEYAVFDKEGKPVLDENNNDVKGTVTFKSGTATGLPAIKDGQQLKISGLPQNQHFKITELDAEKYDTIHQLENISSNSSIRLRGKETNPFKLQQGEETDNTIATFTNAIEPGEFSFSKTIKGPNTANDQDKQFDFYLEAMDKDGNRDETFSGDIEGWKHAGGSDTKVTFHFSSGKATKITINGSTEAIQLRDGENYHGIKLPKNVQFKVYERQDDTYKYTRYTIDGHNHGKAPSKSDGDGDYHYVGPINTDGRHLKFINEQKENSFEFEKRVSATQSEDNFLFNIEAGNKETKEAVSSKQDEDDKKYNASVVNVNSGNTITKYKIIFDEDGKAKIDGQNKDPYNIPLQHGQKFVITGLPIEATEFKVTELEFPEEPGWDWDVYHQVDGDYEREGNEAYLTLNRKGSRNAILFRNLPPELVSFKVKKTVSGVVPPKDKNFEFKLTIKNPQPDWGEKKNFRAIKSGDLEEFNLTFTKDEDGETYSTTKSIKVNESLTVFTPKGLKINIEEKTRDGYEVSHQYGDHNESGHQHQIVTGEGDCGQSCLPPLIFNNHVPGTAVEIEKGLAGNNLSSSDYKKTFNFAITATGQDNQMISMKTQYKLESTNGEVKTGFIEFEDGKVAKVDDKETTRLQLKRDQKMTILGLPAGTKVVIAETNAFGYISSHILNGGSEVQTNKTEPFKTSEEKLSKVKFINTKKNVSLKISKHLAGAGIKESDKSTEFKFEILATALKGSSVLNDTFNAWKYTNTGTTKSEVKFTDGVAEGLTLKDEESINIIGLSDEYSYKIEEIKTEGFEYDVSYKLNGLSETIGNATPEITILHNQSTTVDFINTREGASLEIAKLLSGKGITDADRNKAFQFKVITDKSVDGNYNYVKVDDYSQEDPGTIHFTNGESATIELKDNEKLIISGLPTNSKYIVQEVNGEDFQTAYKIDGTGSHEGKKTIPIAMKDDKKSSVLFVNSKDASSLMIRKTIMGDGLKEGDEAHQFKFDINVVEFEGKLNSEGYDAVKQNADGTKENVKVKFVTDDETGQTKSTITLRHKEFLTISGLPLNVKFNVEEIKDSAENFEISHILNGAQLMNTNKTTNFELHGKMTPVEFVNAKHKPASGSLQIQKELAGTGITEADEDQTFDFQIHSAISGEFKATKFTQSGSVQLLDIQLRNDRSTTIQLKDKERLIISGLPLDTDFSVTELGATDFKTSWVVNDTKTYDGKQTSKFEIQDQQTTPVLFTNAKQKPATANLKISKALAGDGITAADRNQDFRFRIYSGASGTYQAIKNHQNSGTTDNTTVTITNGQSELITLRAGESLQLTGLPIDHTYAVGEEFVAGYVTSYKVNGGLETSGMMTAPFTMIADQNGIVEFTNTKAGEIKMGSLAVNKFVNEAGDRAKTFNFHIEVVDGIGNPLDGNFRTVTTSNGQESEGSIHISGGNATFTLTHGQSIQFNLPMGARYEVSEQDYKADGYTTTVTKRGAAYTGTHVSGTVTLNEDKINYHNDIETDDDATLPLPSDEDTPDSSATLDEPDALPASDGTNGTNGTSGSSLTSPQALPSAGYTGKQALPQTGDSDNKLYVVIGVILLVTVTVVGTIYYTKRKQAK
ncbi:hypothetical protein YK48G_09990 [Lentilactobacillus fungorum]|uniref:Gram-positive cocci surface proteins LPxTG domain-containing protein n=1 Tax=Lentilactobacillus fungorum TaxID=2201250 RepID=A0ABQ3VZ08_9LACO|nr:adhesive domain-containing protein [Lentilactobacillus fungorum]GHP13574.1 hypothetical protein YK48G_09990 [Lentilactobacillus fungorum]